MKNDSEENAHRFIEAQYEITQEFIKTCPGDIFSWTIQRMMTRFDASSWERFENQVLSDPVIFRIAFIVDTPPEEFDLRTKLSQLSPPIRDHRYLCLFAKQQRENGWEPYLLDLARDFLFVLRVDQQKLMGRPETIIELRKTSEKVSEDRDGTLRIETDLWPRAKAITLIKDSAIEIHVYQLKEEGIYPFSNLADEMMIGWIQSFEDRQLRDTAYISGEGGPTILYFVYNPDGKLTKGSPFPYGLRNKYWPLIRKMGRKYPFERRGVHHKAREGFPSWYTTDGALEADAGFWEAILKYTTEKGPPPGYFRMSLQNKLYRAYKKAYKINTDYAGGSLDEEILEGIRGIDIMRSEPQSAPALLAEVIRDIAIEHFKDPIDRLIAQNLDKNDTEIAAVIREKTGKSMTKQAVQKRRVNKVLPLARRLLGIKLVRREEENRGKRKTPLP